MMLVPAPTSQLRMERELVVDSGASMHTLSRKNLSSDEMDTQKKVQTPHSGHDGQWEVQTFEEAHMHVHDLGLFVTVQLLDETPAVLSLGKLCEDHGCSYEWVSGQKPRSTKEGKTITCKNDNHVPLVAPDLSANSGSSTSSTSKLRDQSCTDLSEE